MYLVTIIKTFDDRFLPKFEEVVAFEFELISEDWTVAYFVPVKGNAFDMHFGSEENSAIINKLGENEGFTCFAALTSSEAIALSLIKQSIGGSNCLCITDDDAEFVNVISESKDRYLTLCR